LHFVTLRRSRWDTMMSSGSEQHVGLLFATLLPIRKRGLIRQQQIWIGKRHKMRMGRET
jgi:hypothetical protein